MTKLKLVRLHVNKKYIWGFRAVMFLAATPFLWDVYQAVITGIAQDGAIVANSGNEGNTYFFILAKKIAFALLFLWFCTGGIVASREDTEEPKNENNEL